MYGYLPKPSRTTFFVSHSANASDKGLQVHKRRHTVRQPRRILTETGPVTFAKDSPISTTRRATQEAKAYKKENS